MKKQKTKVKRNLRKKKHTKLIVLSSSCVGALVAVGLLVNYPESDKNILATDAAEGSIVVLSNSVDDVITTFSEVPKLASASMAPEVVTYEEVDISEEVLVISESASEVPLASPQEGSDYNMPVEKFLSYLEIGVDYTHVNFKPQGDPSFHGNLGGLQGSYEYKPKDNVYAGVNFSWKEGNMHGSAGKRSLLYIDAQERLGYTLALKSSDYTFTIFSGLGYRHFGQKLTPNVGSSLKFRYNEFYIPVGIKSDCKVNSWFAMGLDFTWMPQVYPTVAITSLKGARWILADTLANFYVNLPMNFTLTKNKRFHVVVDPFYERWQDGHSKGKTSTGVDLELPRNTYNFWGANVNFLYCF